MLVERERLHKPPAHRWRQRPLRIAAEQLWRVPSPTMPDPGRRTASVENLAKYPALRLFIERARPEHRPGAPGMDQIPAGGAGHLASAFPADEDSPSNAGQR